MIRPPQYTQPCIFAITPRFWTALPSADDLLAVGTADKDIDPDNDYCSIARVCESLSARSCFSSITRFGFGIRSATRSGAPAITSCSAGRLAGLFKAPI